ncbi:MAG: hypothetical protein KKD39_02490, partial [Candidatus Altiarchaeota archaeon]|nr:hypothetical protein [Candidatus Altiarchaeota archaeon]
YLNSKKLWGEKTALMSSVLLVALNPYAILLGLQIQVYQTAAYICLCINYLIFRKTHPALIGFFAGLGHLTHPMCTVYMGALFTHNLVNNRKSLWLAVKKYGLQVVAIFLITISAVLVRNYQIFQNPFYTSASNVMFITSLEDYFRLTPPNPGEYIRYILNPVNFILIKGGSVLKTLVPPPYSFAYNKMQLTAIFDPMHLRYSMAGILTYPLLLACVYTLVKKPKKQASMVFIISLIAAICIYGYRVDYEYGLLYAQVLFLGAYTLKDLQKREKIFWVIVLFLAWESASLIKSSEDGIDYDAMAWIASNTGEEDIIMSRGYAIINYLTDRKTMPTPNEKMETIADTITKYNVSYFAVNNDDLRLRGMNSDILNQKYILMEKTMQYSIYQTKTTYYRYG